MIQTPLVRLAGVFLIALAANATLFALAYDQSAALSFPPVFWWQLMVGNGAIAISGWVWSLRPGDLAPRLFLISGMATLVFTFSPAYLSIDGVEYTRELRIWISLLNGSGASVFGISMILLFLVYPVRLPYWRRWAMVVLAVYGASTIVVLSGGIIPFSSMHPVTLLEMLTIFAALTAQFIFTRGQATSRAILIWLGSAVIIGAGSFIAMVSLPQTLGQSSLFDARLAFGFFLIIYIGCAAGLMRYRLFELGEWAYRALFYALAALLLLALDAFLIFALPVDHGLALALSIIVLSLVYLPFRDRIGRALLNRSSLSDQELFQEVTSTAFAPREQRADLWRRTLQQSFKPLEIRELPDADPEARILEEGLSLQIPRLAGSPPLELRYPWNGQGLFGPSQLRTAQLLVDLMRRAEESRLAHERGASEERSRIARDMHDNIGAQLLGALHSREMTRKDVMIRESLTDLRNIINDTATADESLAAMLADLRAETAERMAAAGIELDWPIASSITVTLSPEACHALRSLIREAVSNTIRHAQAENFRFDLMDKNDRLMLVLLDDGRGFEPETPVRGQGLENMKNRAGMLGGNFRITSDAGTRIEVAFPILSTP